MRITDIYIKNYRAFYGEHHISLDKDGKNLMLYGENGSGKSSLFTALFSFFKASVSKVNIEENIFIPASEKNTASIKLTIRENAEATASQDYEVDITKGEIISDNKTLIVDANKIKGFFDYRSLLETHLKHEESVNIFRILNENILPNAENRFTTNEIGKDWQEIQNNLGLRKGWRVVERLHVSTDNFSKGFKLLLETIEKETNTYLKYFDKSITVKIEFDKCYYKEDVGVVYGQNAYLKITYAGKPIDKHHLFLNEARLSALAISLYLSSIKANPLTGALKILVLDDLLIGLDMSNRLPLLSILKNHFIEINANERFQVIMTTYDKVWFELVNNYFGTESWKYIEIYSKKLKDENFEFPIIKNTIGYLNKAKYYLGEKDNKASAVYIRSEFERLVKNICEKKSLQVVYKRRQKEFTTEDFWEAIKQQTDLDKSVIKQIEIHRGTVMNPFSHDDLESPEFEKELQDTIAEVEKLGKIKPKEELKKYTFKDLLIEKEEVEKKLKYQYIGKIMSLLINKKTAST
jgi:energy-coupling factor transporter ATP-binding protein EcfA2